MSALRAVDVSLTRTASLCARFDDHFTGQPVPETLQVLLLTPPRGPVPDSDGRSPRRADGTYRFTDVPAGNYTLRVRSPSGTWFAPALDLPVALPLVDALEPLVYTLWPSPSSPVATGITAVRGRLSGPAVAGLRVAIKPSALAGPAPNHAFADDQGEFLFLYLARIAVLTSLGGAELEIEVDAGGRSVSGGQVIRRSSSTVFTGVRFSVTPGRESRVLFEVAP